MNIVVVEENVQHANLQTNEWNKNHYKNIRYATEVKYMLCIDMIVGKTVAEQLQENGITMLACRSVLLDSVANHFSILNITIRAIALQKE